MKSDDAARFQGFTRKTLDILSESATRKNRTPSGREEEYLLQPVRTLAEELAGVMTLIDPEIETRQSRVISRNGKSVMLAFRRHAENRRDSPAYFFELFPDGCRYGVGFDAASRETLARIRRAIEAEPQAVRVLLRSVRQVRGMEMAGEEYSRMPALSVPGDLLPLYLKKDLRFVLDRKIDDTIFGRGIAEELAGCFIRLAGVYHFLQNVRCGA